MATKSEELAILIAEEKRLRKEITSSDKYLDIVVSIEEAEEVLEERREGLAAIASPLTEIQKLIDSAKKELIESKNFDSSIFTPKFKVSSVVNTNKFYNVVDNLDEFLSVISITQKTVKDYARDHEDIKNPVLDCIEEVDKKITDLELVSKK